MKPPRPFRALVRELVGHPDDFPAVAQRAAMTVSRARLLAGLSAGTGIFSRGDDRNAVPTPLEAQQLADAFGLVGAPRDEFVLAAALMAASPIIRARVDRLCQRIAELEARAVQQASG